MTAIRQLAAFTAEHPRGGHTPAHIEIAKRALLDTIGCMFLGAAAPVTRTAIAAATSWGAGPCPVYGAGTTLPAPWAALANGASAHAFDLDDYTLAANDHPSAVLVPALLAQSAHDAAGESVPARSGAELLDAYLIGLEVIIRLGEAVNMGHYNLGWHTTATIDSFGATAAISRLKGLNAEQSAMALALTPSLGTGYNSQFGTSAKPIHAGWSAKTGIAAAALAAAGASAYDGALDGGVSFASLMPPAGSAKFEEAFTGLRRTWSLDNWGLGAKLYPSCGYTHRSIDGARAVYDQFGPLTASDVASVRLSLPTHHLAILPFGVPETQNEALFSPAWCAAVALVSGHCVSSDFLPEAVADPERRALAGLVDVVAREPRRPELNVDPEDPDVVEVVLRDGRRWREEVPRWRGAPGREMTEAELLMKFEDVCLRSGLDGGAVSAISGVVRGLDELPDLRELRAVLDAPRSQSEPSAPAA
ncbi:MAG: MmgE/PrpD family protein [Neomegalonema sp.]